MAILGIQLVPSNFSLDTGPCASLSKKCNNCNPQHGKLLECHLVSRHNNLCSGRFKNTRCATICINSDHECHHWARINFIPSQKHWCSIQRARQAKFRCISRRKLTISNFNEQLRHRDLHALDESPNLKLKLRLHCKGDLQQRG